MVVSEGVLVTATLEKGVLERKVLTMTEEVMHIMVVLFVHYVVKQAKYK